MKVPVVRVKKGWMKEFTCVATFFFCVEREVIARRVVVEEVQFFAFLLG